MVPDIYKDEETDMTTGMLPRGCIDFHHVMHEHGEEERVQKLERMCTNVDVRARE